MSPDAQRFIFALGSARGLLTRCSLADLVELRSWAVHNYDPWPVAMIDAELERRRPRLEAPNVRGGA